MGVMVKLNPYAIVLKRNEALRQELIKAGCKPKKSYKKKKEHEWKKKMNFKRIDTASKKSQMTKKQYERKVFFRIRRQEKWGKRVAEKKKKKEEEAKWHAHIKELKAKAREGGKPTMKQIEHMIKRHKKKSL